jgi:hypothetical protein
MEERLRSQVTLVPLEQLAQVVPLYLVLNIESQVLAWDCIWRLTRRLSERAFQTRHIIRLYLYHYFAVPVFP